MFVEKDDFWTYATCKSDSWWQAYEGSLLLFLPERMRMTTYKRKGSRGFAVFALITTEATSLQFPYMN